MMKQRKVNRRLIIGVLTAALFFPAAPSASLAAEIPVELSADAPAKEAAAEELFTESDLMDETEPAPTDTFPEETEAALEEALSEETDELIWDSGSLVSDAQDGQDAFPVLRGEGAQTNSSVVPSFLDAQAISLGEAKPVSSQEPYYRAYFRFSPEKTAVYHIEADNGRTVDSYLRIFAENGALMKISDDASLDDQGITKGFAMDILLRQGSSYYLEAGFQGADTGTYTFTVTENTAADMADTAYAPETDQLRVWADTGTSLSAMAGTDITLKAGAAASDGYRLSYAWTKGGQKIPGETFILMDTAPAARNTVYTCTVTAQKTDPLTGMTSQTSSKLDFTVSSYLFRLADSTRQAKIVPSGSPLTLEVGVITHLAALNLDFQWAEKKDGSWQPLDASYSSYLTVTPTGGEDTVHDYRCTVTGSDKAGNTQTRALSFSVLSFAPHSDIGAAVDLTGESSSRYTGTAWTAGGDLSVYRFIPRETAQYTLTGSAPAELLDSSGNVLSSFTAKTDAELYRYVTDLCAGQTYYLRLKAPDGSPVQLTAAAERTGAHTHSFGEWIEMTTPTALTEGAMVRTCHICRETERTSIPRLAPYLTMNVKRSGTIPLKVKQKTSAIRVTGLQTGDEVISWTSSKPRLVSVKARGNSAILKAGSKKGTAVITVATKGGASCSFKVKVQKSTVTTKRIQVSRRTITLKRGQTYAIGALVTPLTSQQKLTCSSSRRSVATVKKGVITARKKGTATITLRSGKKTVKLKIRVK